MRNLLYGESKSYIIELSKLAGMFFKSTFLAIFNHSLTF